MYVINVWTNVFFVNYEVSIVDYKVFVTLFVAYKMNQCENKTLFIPTKRSEEFALRTMYYLIDYDVKKSPWLSKCSGLRVE